MININTIEIKIQQTGINHNQLFLTMQVGEAVKLTENWNIVSITDMVVVILIHWFVLCSLDS